tara:strand:- start:2097 stop:2603 length:507 start_codon:yes stop_codon:yes gene_type:complete
MSTVLFISSKKLKDSTALNGNVDVAFLQPHVLLAQKKHVKNRLGTQLYDKIEADIIAGTLSGDYKILVDDFISEMLVHWSFYEAIPFLRFKVQNNNIVSKTAENSNPLSTSEAKQLRIEIRDTAEFFTEALVNHLCHNSSKYPEYTTNSLDDVRADRGDSYYSGLYLG